MSLMVSSLVSAAYGDGRRPFMAVVELLPIPRPDRPIDVKKQFAIAIWRDDGIDAVGLEVFVRLKDAFGRRPVILALVYYNCPMLCTQVLNGLVASLNVMSLSAGTDFDVLASHTPLQVA